MIFETHAHFDDKAYDKDRETLLKSLEFHGIEGLVNVGADMKSSRRSIELAKEYPFVYAAVGVHPEQVEELNEDALKELEEMAKEEKVVAIGEIGLDYYYDEVPKDIQKKWFIAQLELAVRQKKPVIIHSRDAASDTMEIMKEYQGKLTGIIHCFSYSKECAEFFVKCGYYLGIGGVVTFSNAKKLKEVVKEVPMDRIVLETDCPYLTPTPYRGKRNSSHYLPYVAEKIAKIREMPTQEVIRITNENAKRVYGIEKRVEKEVEKRKDGKTQ
ncbi:MAG: TatD family hydrolase [Lachnospiraceae bacterium]|nr:TatD family hydrolase [Lachnospiraceae bacterium]